MAETLGIRPWEIDRLTVEEFRQAVAYLDDIVQRSKEAIDG